jgi:hypothetical protein
MLRVVAPFPKFSMKGDVGEMTGHHILIFWSVISMFQLTHLLNLKESKLQTSGRFQKTFSLYQRANKIDCSVWVGKAPDHTCTTDVYSYRL